MNQWSIKNTTMALLISTPILCHAGDSDLTVDAAIGGAIGGAVGGAIGAELGGRDGAIIGASVGAAAGTAINTTEYATPDRHRVHSYEYRAPRYHSPPQGRFCPPGQAKKGRC